MMDDKLNGLKTESGGSVSVVGGGPGVIVGRAMIIACARTVAVCGTAGFGGVGLSASTERGVAVGHGLEMPGHPGVVVGFGSRAGGGFAGGCGGFEGGCGGFGVSTGLGL